MIDIARDPRWGRVAESLGEDPYLTGVLGAAMVRGFQGDDLTAPGAIAACAKHFAGYGASESGRDYNTTNIPENELRNVYLPPFKAAVDAGRRQPHDVVQRPRRRAGHREHLPAADRCCARSGASTAWWSATGSRSASSPCTASPRTTASRPSRPPRPAWTWRWPARTYADHLASLVRRGRVAERAASTRWSRNILRVEVPARALRRPVHRRRRLPGGRQRRRTSQAALRRRRARASCCSRTTTGRCRSMPTRCSSLAVIGPLADDPYEQLGTWIFDGDASAQPYGAAGDPRHWPTTGSRWSMRRGVETTRSRGHDGFAAGRRAGRAVRRRGAGARRGGDPLRRGALPRRHHAARRAAGAARGGRRDRQAGHPRAHDRPPARARADGAARARAALRVAPRHAWAVRPSPTCSSARASPIRQAARDVPARDRADPDLLRAQAHRQAADAGVVRAHRRHRAARALRCRWATRRSTSTRTTPRSSRSAIGLSYSHVEYDDIRTEHARSCTPTARS